MYASPGADGREYDITTYGRDNKPGGEGTTPISAPPRSIKDSPPACGNAQVRSKGFTLVEILVVVVIMAVVISLAMLSIGVTGRDAQLDEETRRIED